MTRTDLAVAVFITGLLSLNSTSCLRRYIANSKTAEARNVLGQLGKSAAMAYERERMPPVLAPGKAAVPIRELCASATKSVPASIASVRGMKYQSAPSDWLVDAPDGGFACLKFTMDQPQYYMYSYLRTGAGSGAGDGFVARANGDLNGDGVTSTFELKGQIAPGGTLDVAPALLEVNPTE